MSFAPLGRRYTKIKLHDLRHTFATDEGGEGKDPHALQLQLGHSTIVTTMDTYAHISEKPQREIAAALEPGFRSRNRNESRSFIGSSPRMSCAL